MPRGLFITFEGPEGAGKTTQIEKLLHWLSGRGINAIKTREPGGTDVAEQLRKIVKYHKGEEPLTDQTELLLFAASRSQHVSFMIKPAMDAGTAVLCDRFTDSTTAYQGYARGMELDFIEKLNRFATDGLKPDITFLLDLTADAGLERAVHREEPLFRDDRIENETKQFHESVREGYLKIAEREPERVKIVNAAAAPDEVHAQITAILAPILDRISEN